MTQWHEELAAIVKQREIDEASGKRRPHIPIRVHFARFINYCFIAGGALLFSVLGLALWLL